MLKKNLKTKTESNRFNIAMRKYKYKLDVGKTYNSYTRKRKKQPYE